ncbi:MAG TPA: homoserine O-acetyltransferase [Planctomycetaceae bacterium]|nr:homoserine O-acetyltransferase [Planctomycetaceae bacterium]
MASEFAEPHCSDGRSVGLVETQSATLFEPPDVLVTEGRKPLGPITVAYETYGELSPGRDNAIFVCHALTGDAHAAGVRSADDRKPGWWDAFIGPGKGLDTDRYFVICANILGGCQGTTGPSSIDPATGRRFCTTFPFITVGDIVAVHSKLVEHLGIDRLLAAIGGSLGGMQVLEWAARFPKQLGAAVVLASAAKLSAQGIAFNAVGKRAILSDPGFKNGEFYDDGPPRFGLALARMLAHITYLSEASIERKFGRRLQNSERLAYELLQETEFQIESYLHHQGKRFVERFDANSYLYLTRAMDYFNLAESYGSIESALSRTDARFLVVSYTTDWLFPTSQSKELVRALLATRRDVTFLELDSPYGHDSFLIPADMDRLASIVGPFLERTQDAVRRRAPVPVAAGVPEAAEVAAGAAAVM